MTYIELLRRKLCTSLVFARREFGAIISKPSTRRKVVENRPNSFTKRGCGLDERPELKHTVFTHIIVNHHKVPHIKYMRREYKDKLQLC